jgi:hypothetical protein
LFLDLDCILHSIKIYCELQKVDFVICTPTASYYTAKKPEETEGGVSEMGEEAAGCRAEGGHEILQ